MVAKESEFFITRHTQKGEGVEGYPGISQEGVELAKKRVERYYTNN